MTDMSMSSKANMTLLCHGLYEMCESELEGDQPYGHLGFWYEKYRQHQKYHPDAANPEKISNAFQESSKLFAYVRQYLHKLSLHDSFDSTVGKTDRSTGYSGTDEQHTNISRVP